MRADRAALPRVSIRHPRNAHPDQDLLPPSTKLDPLVSTPDDFFVYVCATDTAGADVGDAFVRARQWWATEMHIAYTKDLDRYGQCPVDDDKPHYQEYIRGTIASRARFLAVADTPLTLTQAQNLAAHLRSTHPEITASTELAGAIPVRGETVFHELDIPIPDRDLTEGFRTWLDHAAKAAVAVAYPAETLEEIRFFYQHRDHGTEQIRASLHSRGGADQHTGWAFFA
ncbi:hypothetical protein ACIHDR_48255 [Nocardia sp. NPDC052278]|uniref:hypothetical protein n=1 Tax=unclassified Nocardia TaxID=2637762 RepID=UPI00369D207A